MGILWSLLSMGLAATIAAVVGGGLGRLAMHWFSGGGLTNVLTDVRGALLPLLVIPAAAIHLDWPRWLLIGSTIGLWQAAAVARWIGRRSGEWSPALVGGLALGRSGAALLTRKAASRGAVVASISSAGVQVVTVEALLVLVGWAPGSATSSLGAWLLNAVGAFWIAGVAAMAGAIVGTEWVASRVLQTQRD